MLQTTEETELTMPSDFRWHSFLVSADYLPDTHLSLLKRTIEEKVGYEKIQLVTISRPSAYGEYEPYEFVDTEEEFFNAVVNM